MSMDEKSQHVLSRIDKILQEILQLERHHLKLHHKMPETLPGCIGNYEHPVCFNGPCQTCAHKELCKNQSQILEQHTKSARAQSYGLTEQEEQVLEVAYSPSREV